MGRDGMGSKYAQRRAMRMGLFVTEASISDGDASNNEIGTIEVSQDAGSAFVVDTGSLSQEMKN